MKTNGNKCLVCKSRIAPGDGCDTHGGFYCDSDHDRICPRCGSHMPPVAVDGFDVKGCEKCDRSSKLPMIERKRNEIERLISKAQQRLSSLGS